MLLRLEDILRTAADPEEIEEKSKRITANTFALLVMTDLNCLSIAGEELEKPRQCWAQP